MICKIHGISYVAPIYLPVYDFGIIVNISRNNQWFQLPHWTNLRPPLHWWSSRIMKFPCASKAYSRVRWMHSSFCARGLDWGRVVFATAFPPLPAFGDTRHSPNAEQVRPPALTNPLPYPRSGVGSFHDWARPIFAVLRFWGNSFLKMHLPGSGPKCGP